MASEARSRSPQDGARRRRENTRSPYVTLGAVRYSVRRVPAPRACPCRCCSEEAVAACLGRAKPDRRTLDRIQRHLGRGSRDERPSRHQRLQALTDLLRPRPHQPPPPPPLPPPPHTAPVLPPVPPPRLRHRHSPPRGASVDRCDEFDADNITLVRVEPRSIVGSYAQKTIPYRSASFSQGDFAQEKYYRESKRQPSAFDFGKRTIKAASPIVARLDTESSSNATDENVTEEGSIASVASVDSAVGSDEGLLTHASAAGRSPPLDGPHKILGARSLTHPLPRRIPPVREEGPSEAGGSLPALMAPRVLHELREESDGSQADSAQAHSEGTSPLEPNQPFSFPPLPDPPANACANIDCDCSQFPVTVDSHGIDVESSDIASSIPVPVYECIVKQWSKELPHEELHRSDGASDGSLDRDKEDETITSEQVANLLAAVQNPCTPAPIGARERRRPLDKTKRRKGIYITTPSDEGGEEDPPSLNGCKRESSDASLQDMRLSAETRTSSILGDKSDDSFTNGPPSPSDSMAPIWPRSEEVKSRRARFYQQSSDERDDDSYQPRRKYGDSPSTVTLVLVNDSDSCSRDRTASPSDTSDVEAKRQQFCRGPFGKNLEAPPSRSVEVGRRSFSDATVPSRKTSVGAMSVGSRGRGPTHVRATSSPSKLAGVKPGTDLLAELLRGSSEALSNSSAFDNVILTLHQHNDTRTHVVVELYETEKSYVEALEILVKKYLQPLKSPENAALLDAYLVDEIFYQVPAILNVHQVFLEQLRRRLEQWDLQQKVGDVFLEVFTKPAVMDTYMSFISNLKKAKETIKTAASSRPAFAKFLDAMARDHKGKLSLDNLLIKPVQKFPSYKLLIQRLIKHTDQSHPDHKLLLEAQKQIHDLLEFINCTEKESLEYELQQQTLRDLEQMIEGLSNLVTADRLFIKHEMVTMPSAQGTIKDRALFLFNDTLLITSVKRRTGTIKKPMPTYQSTIASQMEGNKYKLLMRMSLADLDIIKAKDENVRRIINEVEKLREDVNTLTLISDHVAALHTQHAQLEELVRDMLHSLNRQLSERQNSDGQLCCMEITLNTANGPENLTIIFSKPDKRNQWEEIINDVKQKLCLYGHERPPPEFLSPVPIRKTRAGLQFTCAAPTLPPPGQSPDVWVCNSDGYVGQVCVLTLTPKLEVTSCNGVCNARILCVACVPPAPALTRQQTVDVPSTSSLSSTSSVKPGISISDPDDSCKNVRLDSSSSSDEEDDGSSSETQDAQSERSQDSARLLHCLARTLTPSHSKSLSTPHTGQNIQVHPVMKSSSNPAVDKQAMGISAGTLSSPASRQSSEDNATTANQPTMWLGTEDGCIHVYNCMDNIRIKKNKVKLQHNSGVHSIVFVEGKVFVALGNGDLVVYCRDIDGSWTERSTISVGTGSTPVSSMLLSGGKLWCATHASIKIINPHTLQVDETFQISSETKPISHMAVAGVTIWLSLHNAAQLRCYNTNTREQLAEINITPQVSKMLHGCDDIIRQHKAACLRVTALLAHRDMLWVGTSAGVLLTAPLLNAPNARTGVFTVPQLTGVTYGHTGHVRFLTIVENPVSTKQPPKSTQTSLKTKALSRRSANAEKLQKQAETGQTNKETLVISGGDGYEDFRSSTMTEDAGREDSTNHLLLWRV
ncbi:rho guanine nucleotide exchange factor 17 isoform X1 [Bombyx mori]|uniref:DH domain-containing protein n=1 Tax=Bombyx mori TaxID=7091 RepID=A0A8R2GCC1_BOMMO|nr:rho guanine nucleotide exchange factor 17 isoform X2 [Bombyx mori]